MFLSAIIFVIIMINIIIITIIVIKYYNSPLIF